MNLRELGDQVLLDRLAELVRQERENTAEVIAHLAEADSRGLAEERGYPSLFVYCLKVLGYSAPCAFHRIRAARAVQKNPKLLELLRSGELHLRAIVLLHPHLQADNAKKLVEQAIGKSERELEALLAPLSPKPESRDTIRIIAVQPKSAEDMPLFHTASPQPSAIPAPETRVRVSFFANTHLLGLLDRAKELLRHKHPGGRLEAVFEEALKALLERRDPNLWAPPKRRGASATRKIPRWVRHEVWKRDAGRCVYEAEDGRRCQGKKKRAFSPLAQRHLLTWAGPESLGPWSLPPSLPPRSRSGRREPPTRRRRRGRYRRGYRRLP